MTEDPASLSNLRDIVAPEAVSGWPLAPGWWVVIGLALVLMATLVTRGVIRHRRNAYRRAALAELASLESSASLTSLATLSELLKRTALAAWPREQIASLTGESWLQFLDDSMDGEGFVDGPGRVLATASSTAAASEADPSSVFSLARRWIETHAPPSAPNVQHSTSNSQRTSSGSAFEVER